MKRVGVVGLGVAGLRAAMILEQAGCDVSLFEARDRLGGRLCTVDQGDGAVYDSGGEWIDSDHERVLSLLAELQISTFVSTPVPRRFSFAGEWCDETTLWQDALEHEIRLEAAAKELCRNLHRPAWDNWQAAELDGMSLGELIDKLSTTDRGRWYLRARALSDEGDDPERIGLLGWLAGYMNYLDRSGGEMSACRIEGGADALLSQMKGRIRARPQFGTELTRVEQGSRVKVTLGEQHEFDHVVLTLPPRCLERVAFDPPMTPEKRCAIEACRMSPIIKLCLEFKSKWWQMRGWDGSMQCDLPLQQTWDGSRGPRAILTAYVCGSQAQDWINSANPVLDAVQLLVNLFPEAEEEFCRGWLHDWPSDPYSMGGFSQTPPGYVLKHMRHISLPEGNVHFAGEHTSPWLGFIEGALESAERACAEVLGHGNSI